MSEEKPRLRQLDRIVMPRADESLVVLHDPLKVSDPVALDADFLPVLDLLSGQRTLPQIRQTLLMRGGGLDVAIEELEAFVDDLSVAGLLDDDNFRERWAVIHEAFLASESLEPPAAGLLYPAKSEHFEALFESEHPRLRANSTTRALWLPCEPIERVAPLLDDMLQGLPSADELDLIVLLAADGQQSLLPYCSTAKTHLTPHGPARVDAKLVEAIEQDLPWLRREEIRHRSNVGLDLGAALMKWLYGETCPPLLPVCCGPSSLEAGSKDAEAFFDALEIRLMRRRPLFVSIASLSHCGPAYGQDEYDGEAQRDDDAACLDAFMSRAPQTFLRRVMQSPALRARGAAPGYALCRLLDPDDEVELDFYQVLSPPGSDQEDAGAGMAAGGIGCAGLRVQARRG